MYYSGNQSSGVKSLLTELFESRRSKFNYVDVSKQGAFRKSAIPQFILNSLGSCLSIPVLFFASFHTLRLYGTYGVELESLLSVLFYAAALSVLADIFIGYFYDRLVKLNLNSIRIILTIIGTLGVIFCLGYLFRYDTRPDEVLKQFRWTILCLTVAYTLANTGTFKNSANFTPSQVDRSKLLYAEYMIKAFFILAYVCFPYWIGFWKDNCKCGEQCSSDGESPLCTVCINTCDTYMSAKIFRDVTLAFTSLFGLANIIVQLAITPRNDQEQEEVSTTFNRRISETKRNGLLIKTFWITLVQYLVLFGFGFWINNFIDTRTNANPSCTNFWGSLSYFCTRSWLKQLALILVTLVSFIFYLCSLKWRFIKGVANNLPLVLIPAGILLIFIDFEQGLMVFFITLVTAFFYPTLAVNQLYFSDGIFYDEYLAGSNQPHFASALYHMATKIGFYLSLAFHISLLEVVPDATLLNNRDSFGLGILFIVASLVLFVLNYSLKKYDINAFDKIQVAIERNSSNIVQTLNFYDPIDGDTLKRPVYSANAQERPVISLLYNLDPRDELRLGVSGKYQDLKSNAVGRLVLFVILLIVFTVLVIIFGKYLDTRWGWLVFLGLLALPLSFYGALYNYNVWQTGTILSSYKYGGYETSVIAKFEPLAKESL